MFFLKQHPAFEFNPRDSGQLAVPQRNPLWHPSSFIQAEKQHEAGIIYKLKVDVSYKGDRKYISDRILCMGAIFNQTIYSI